MMWIMCRVKYRCLQKVELLFLEVHNHLLVLQLHCCVHKREKQLIFYHVWKKRLGDMAVEGASAG